MRFIGLRMGSGASKCYKFPVMLTDDDARELREVSGPRSGRGERGHARRGEELRRISQPRIV